MAVKSLAGGRQSLTCVFPKEVYDYYRIGDSPFGTVYKGTLQEGGTIAVLRISEPSPIMPCDKKIETEFAYLMTLQNENIVKLFRSCTEAQKKIVQKNGRYFLVDMLQHYLLFEYPPKGTLDKYISAESSTFDWATRFKIIEGVCQGLHYLHVEAASPIVHMNLHPTVIWLDDNWVPKIAEYGLSSIFGQEQTRINTMNVLGKNGYMAPEYLDRGEISRMSDIFSLGMLIMEITTGERNLNVAEDRSARVFMSSAHQYWRRNNDMITSKYPSLDPNGLLQVITCIAIGLKCTEVQGPKRPSIVDIVNVLNETRTAVFDQVGSEGEIRGHTADATIRRAIRTISASMRHGGRGGWAADLWDCSALPPAYHVPRPQLSRRMWSGSRMCSGIRICSGSF